jgi:hypothetical protein
MAERFQRLKTGSLQALPSSTVFDSAKPLEETKP